MNGCACFTAARATCRRDIEHCARHSNGATRCCPPEESAVFRRMGVFVGGFSLELAQQVASDNAVDAWTVLDALGGLVDKSLVSVGAAANRRATDCSKVHASSRSNNWGIRGEADVSPAALRGPCVRSSSRRPSNGSATTAAPRWSSYMARVGAEVDNARAALDYAERSGDWPAAVTLAGAAALAFMQHGLTVEIGRPHEGVGATRR